MNSRFDSFLLPVLILVAGTVCLAISLADYLEWKDYAHNHHCVQVGRNIYRCNGGEYIVR